ncbi:MAG TPA: Fe(2+)-trafficking protein [Phycisphaerales bacterium]|nr:Fe(2+)-trafficking protein [Phycisphaerales bacterium]
MDIEQRIAQFEKMAHDDPDNDMAHFSLGGAYNQAGRFAEAAASYQRCIALNPGMSKAYQLAGAALMACGREDEAAEVLTRGYTAAAERGDLMPKKAIGELLERLGRPIPEVRSAAPAVAPPSGGFVCGRTGRPGTKMDRPPFRGPVGEWIASNISRETWESWIAQGTKVINELRLDLSRDEDAATYDQHMREFLGMEDADNAGRH